MRAAVLRNTGDEKLEIVDNVEANPPGPTDVTIKIEATGVCHSDLHAMNGDLPQGAPFVPGHEGAGIISAVGSAVTDLRVGDHVIVAWSPPCGKCNQCVERKSPHLCVMIQFAIAGLPRFSMKPVKVGADGAEGDEGDQQLYGMAGFGTFAEYLTVPQEGAIKIPDDVPFDIASLIGCGLPCYVQAKAPLAHRLRQFRRRSDLCSSESCRDQHPHKRRYHRLPPRHSSRGRKPRARLSPHRHW